MKSYRSFIALSLFPLAFLAIFFYIPLLSILQEGLFDATGHLTARYILATLQEPYNRRVILFTIQQALLSTLLTLVLGFPGAYLVAKFDFPGKSLLKAITTVPFVLPSIIVSLGFVLLFGNNGFLNRGLMALLNLETPPLRILYSLKAIVLAHAFYNFPLVVRVVSAIWSSIDPRLEDAARSLGAREYKVFWHITLPMILPGIIASLALTFIFSFMSFAVVLVLGGVKYTTIEVNIYTLMTVLLDYKMGSALAIVQSLFSLSFMFFYAKILEAGARTEKVAVDTYRVRPQLFTRFRELLTWRGIAILFYLLVVLLVILGPLLSVLSFSVIHHEGDQTRLSLKSYYKIFTIPYTPILGTTPLKSIQNSLFFGVMTVFFALPLGVTIAFILARAQFPLKNLFDAIVMLPLGISSISLGLGYVRSFHKPPLMIVGTWYAIVFAHTIIAYPFVMRSVLPILKKMKPTLVDAAMSLGATRLRSFLLIELPIVKPGIIVGATFTFAISIGELGATYMLYRPHLTTMPISIYRFLSSHDLIGASAMGMVLIAVCTLLFLCIEKTGYKTF
ncbi:ABC transporter permease subunit [candidate division KSB3 bacterium]|uniref:ABC transporter permease subunit n=1 Tax=candidate division KSB3 bacterium TaxID=2044937 RepID=A0A9D5JZN6_9BACT|nr:ABC transporter permease subunit [candidate division KSB3 bacterium]MBD3327309.1 ABC transporter permease subunit [candidate division KSB3 bacterium]